MEAVIGNIDKVVEKYSVMDNLFGIAITCLIIGLFLLLYYRKIEGYLFKPFKLLLQFCVNAFLIVGLIGVLIEGGFHIVNKFSGKSPQSDNVNSNIVSEVVGNNNTKDGTQKQISNNQTISGAEAQKIDSLPLENLIPLVIDGNPLAQYRLGFHYEFGIGVDKDEQKAFEWYSKAAEQGDAEAQNKLGYMYYMEQYVNEDYKKAFEWYSKAAEQGYDSAQLALGSMYSTGSYVNKDYKKAFEWYSKAAEQGNAFAQDSLGLMYYLGNYVNEDYKKAYMWYSLSKLFGRNNSQSLRNLEKSLSSSQVREAIDEAQKKYDEIKKRMNK